MGNSLNEIVKFKVKWLKLMLMLKFVKYRKKSNFLWKRLLTGTVPVNNSLLTGTVPVNNFLLTGTVPVNNFLLTGTVPVNNSLLTGTGSLSIIPY